MPPATTAMTKIVATAFSQRTSGLAMVYAPAISATTAAVIVHCCRLANLSSSQYAALVVESIAISASLVHILGFLAASFRPSGYIAIYEPCSLEITDAQNQPFLNVDRSTCEAP